MNRLKNVVKAAPLLISIVLMVGCNIPVTTPLPVDQPVQLASVWRENAMLTAQGTLKRMGFSIEKFDADKGYIRTWPLTGGQFFQLTRGDNATAKLAAEANLHTIQRIVIMRFEAQNDNTTVTCEVSARRLSIPEEAFAGVREHAGIYTQGEYDVQTLRMNVDNDQIRWIYLGRDADLENKILGKLTQKLQKGK